MNRSTCICGSHTPRCYFSENFDALICSDCGSRHFVAGHGEGATEFLYDEHNAKYNEPSVLYGKQLRWAHHRLQARKWSGKKILEIGCFNGFFLDDLMRKGANAYGFDVNEKALAVGRKLFGLEGRLFSSLETIRGLGPFDEILCIDVLEHLDDPEHFIQQIGALLTARGKFALASPTIERRFHDKSDYPPHHRWWFSRAGLQTLLEHNGYSLEETHIQYDGLLLLRNFLGKVVYGLERREFYGDVAITNFNTVNGFVAATYEGAAELGRLLFTLLGISYCSTLIIAAKDEPA